MIKTKDKIIGECISDMKKVPTKRQANILVLVGLLEALLDIRDIIKEGFDDLNSLINKKI